MYKRPNPEKLLQRANLEEGHKTKGNLKIYLGAAPGVGKTYAMLKDAQEKRIQVQDVVIGVVETHGRREIEELIKNLEFIPLQTYKYHGIELQEFDLDAALKRKPRLILIDEMAHTNVPGLRHKKRWQDIKELLDCGIDVYTTLNVQHIESLSDDVEQIIGIRINETVPDSMLEAAETIELIDIPPEDLLKRLQEGKVYFPEQIEIAKDNYFKKGNLIALRELALRTAAEWVDTQVLLYRQGEDITSIWPTREKILACVGPGVGSVKVIHTAKRLAASLKTEWEAVFVDVPGKSLSEEKRNLAVQNLRLAEQLGAKTRVLIGDDIVNEIMNFAHEQNITMIVIRKKIHSRWRDKFIRNLADEIVRHSGEIDVYVMTDAVSEKPIAKMFGKEKTPLFQYGISLGIVAAASIINFLINFFSPWIGAENLIMIYLLSVICTALIGYFGPTILAALTSVLAYNFFFLPPMTYTDIFNPKRIITLIIMLIIALIISGLMLNLRRKINATRLEERQTATLHTLSNQLANARGVDKLLDIAVKFLGDYFQSEVMVLLPNNSQIEIRAYYKTNPILTEKEYSIAKWVLELGQTAGIGTDTLSFSEALYVPLQASQNVLGVVRMCPFDTDRLLSPSQIKLIESSANQIALALEVDRMQDEIMRSELREETDRVRNSLLKSFSQDLRAPLVAGLGLANTLMEQGDELDKIKVKKVAKKIYLELEQLSRLINNLLQIIYLESNAVRLKVELCSLEELVKHVIAQSKPKLGKRTIYPKIQEGLPQIPLDLKLIQEVFINLIDNAIKFTPPATDIDIVVIVQVENDRIQVSVEDQGPGIVQDEVNKLFEKFYRGRMITSERGLGLGLAICKRIIEAHGGKIWAENRKEGGAAFRFTLLIHNESFEL